MKHNISNSIPTSALEYTREELMLPTQMNIYIILKYHMQCYSQECTKIYNNGTKNTVTRKQLTK